MFFNNSRDQESLDNYIKNVKTAVKRNLFIQKYAHIHTNTSIRMADPDTDYIYDESFRDRAFIIDWKFSREGCDAASCFPLYKPASTCTIDTKPIQTHPTITSCGPACFAVRGVINPFYARWINTKCINMDAGVIAFFLDPALRANPTGRDSYTMTVKFPNESREFVATVDSGYCRQFGMVYDSVNGQCDTTSSSAGYVVSFFTGESLIKIFRLGANHIDDFFVSLLSRARSDAIENETNPTTTTETAEEIRQKWISTTGVPLPVLDIPISLTKLGIITDGDIWTNGTVTHRSVRTKRNVESVYDKSRSLFDKISDDIIKSPYSVIGGFAVDHVITRAKKYIIQLKKNLLINTRIMSTVEKRVASSVIRHMTIDRVVVETGKMVTLSAKLSTAALSAVGLISIIGPVLDLFWAMCWDPLYMTFRPMSDADARKIIQTAAVNKWKTDPVEFLPENAWDNYYGATEKKYDEIMYGTLTQATMDYIKSRTVSAMGSQISNEQLFDDRVLNYDTMPSFCMRLRELRNVTTVLSIMGGCMVFVIEKWFIIFVVIVVISIILNLKIYHTIRDYNKNMTSNMMDSVEYII